MNAYKDDLGQWFQGYGDPTVNEGPPGPPGPAGPAGATGPPGPTGPDIYFHGVADASGPSGGRYSGTDNTEALVTALASSGKLLFGPGSYRFQQPASAIPNAIAPTRCSIIGIPGQSIICLDQIATDTHTAWWLAPANYADPDSSTLDRYEYLHIEGMTFYGLWQEQATSGITMRYIPLQIENYARVEIVNCRFENIYGMAVQSKLNGSFYATGNVLDMVARDGLRATGTPDVQIIGNWIRRSDDDAIAVLSRDIPSPDVPQRGRIVVANNIIEQSEGIQAGGAHEMQVTGNILHLCHGTALNVSQSQAPEGSGGKSHVIIEGNLILNHLNHWQADTAVWGDASPNAAMSIGGQEVSGYRSITFAGNNASDVQVGADTITSSGHPFTNGVRVLYDSVTAGGAIGGLVNHNAYYVVNATASTLQLALTAGGAAIDLTGLGTGSLHRLLSMPGEYLNATQGVLSPWGLKTAGATSPKWGWLNPSGNNTEGFVTGGSHNFIVRGNVIARTLPLVNNYADWGYGPLISNDVGLINPPIDDTAFCHWGLRILGDGRNMLVDSNLIFGFREDTVGGKIRVAMFLDRTATSYNDKTFKALRISNNLIRDCGVGIRTSLSSAAAPSNWEVEVIGNIINCDPYVKSSRRNATLNGTWQIADTDDLNPICIDIAGVYGWVLKNNSFQNAYAAVHPLTESAQSDRAHIEANLLKCDPAAIGSDAGNKGLANIPRASVGNRFVIWGSDPTANDWDVLKNNCPLYGTAKPTTGTYVEGHFVHNTAYAIAAGKVVLGWARLTGRTGTGHVADTDWAAVYATNS